jgi:hypothetical protein
MDIEIKAKAKIDTCHQPRTKILAIFFYNFTKINELKPYKYSKDIKHTKKRKRKRKKYTDQIGSWP